MKKQQEEFYPAALTIAESDSGGGTGIQADLRTFNAAGIYGASVITAVTAQNPRRMATAEVCSAVLVGKQLECVLDALAIKAVKTGWLGDENIARTVAESLRRCRLPLVVDPVMISTSGHKLLPGKGMDIVRNEKIAGLDCELFNIQTGDVVAAWNTSETEEMYIENLQYSFDRPDSYNGNITYAIRITDFSTVKAESFTEFPALVWKNSQTALT